MKICEKVEEIRDGMLENQYSEMADFPQAFSVFAILMYHLLTYFCCFLNHIAIEVKCNEIESDLNQV